MSFSPTPFYTEPNVYTEITNSAPASVPIGAFVPAAIGLGAKTRVTKETLTHASLNGKDTFGAANSPVAVVQSVIGADQTIYQQGVDFLLERTGVYPYTTKIDWSPTASLTGTAVETFNVDLLTLYLRIDGTNYSFPLLGLTETAAQVAAQINAVLAGIASSSGGYLVLSANSVEIRAGVANASDILGFIVGQSAQVKEPAVGTLYDVQYSYVKPLSAYNSGQIFSRLDDVFAEWGTPRKQNVLIQQLVGATVGGDADSLQDTSAPFGSVNYTGKYLLITAGDAAGQIRVILYNTNDTLYIGEQFDVVPTTNTNYQIVDNPPYSISLGLQLAGQNGATFFIGSQSRNDIFDSDNLRKALDNLENTVNGTDPYVLLYMKGLSTNDTGVISAIKSQVINMSSLLVGKRRIALVGSVANISSFQTFQTLSAAFGNSPNTPGEGRFVVMCPSDGKVTLPGGQVTVDGSFLAAILSGIVVNPNFDFAEPISGKTVTGIDSINNPFLRKELNLIAGGGSTILELQGGSINVRHALTTDMTNALSQELKVMRIKDGLANVLTANLRKAFINVRSTGTILDKAIEVTVRNILQNFIDQRIILTYRNLEIITPRNFPRQKNVNFEFVPVFDNNYILLQFGAALQ